MIGNVHYIFFNYLICFVRLLKISENIQIFLLHIVLLLHHILYHSCLQNLRGVKNIVILFPYVT